MDIWVPSELNNYEYILKIIIVGEDDSEKNIFYKTLAHNQLTENFIILTLKSTLTNKVYKYQIFNSNLNINNIYFNNIDIIFYIYKNSITNNNIEYYKNKISNKSLFIMVKNTSNNYLEKKTKTHFFLNIKKYHQIIGLFSSIMEYHIIPLYEYEEKCILL